MVDIYVGPKSIHHHLPLSLLSHHSAFFDKAFNGSFKEGSTKRLDLPDEDVHAFNLLVQWMYTGRVDSPKRIEGAKSAKAINDKIGSVAIPVPVLSPSNPRWASASMPNVPVVTMQIRSDNYGAKPEPYPVETRSHLKLYVLADKLDMRALKNKTIDVIIRAGCGIDPPMDDWTGLPRHPSSFAHFDPETIDWIYQNTMPKSPLRKLASASAAYTMVSNGVDINHYQHCLHQDFLIDLVKGMQMHADSATYTRVVPTKRHCIYHDHHPGEVCYAKDTFSNDRLFQLNADAKFVWMEVKRSFERGGITVQQLSDRTGYSVGELNHLKDELMRAGLVCATMHGDIWIASEL